MVLLVYGICLVIRFGICMATFIGIMDRRCTKMNGGYMVKWLENDTELNKYLQSNAIML